MGLSIKNKMRGRKKEMDVNCNIPQFVFMFHFRIKGIIIIGKATGENRLKAWIEWEELKTEPGEEKAGFPGAGGEMYKGTVLRFQSCGALQKPVWNSSGMEKYQSLCLVRKPGSRSVRTCAMRWDYLSNPLRPLTVV